MAIFPIILPITFSVPRALNNTPSPAAAPGLPPWENPGDFPCGFSEKKKHLVVNPMKMGI